MGFASPFPDVDIADVSVFGLALTAMVIGGWSRSREIFGGCGWAAGGGYPFCGGAFGVRAGLRVGWMVTGCL